MENTNLKPSLQQFLTSRFRPTAHFTQSPDLALSPETNVDFQKIQAEAISSLGTPTSSLFSNTLASINEPDSLKQPTIGDLTGGIDNTNEDEDAGFSLKLGNAGTFSRSLLEKSQSIQEIIARLEKFKTSGLPFLPENLETELDIAMNALGRGTPISGEQVQKTSLLFFNFTSIQISTYNRSTTPEEKAKAEDLASAGIVSIAFFAAEYDSDQSVEQLTTLWKDIHQTDSENMLEIMENILRSLYHGTPFQIDSEDPDSTVGFKPALPARAGKLKQIIADAGKTMSDAISLSNVINEEIAQETVDPETITLADPELIDTQG
jgi:hypothetical protein